jgi:anthranilate phosphoribosyltransferase
MRALVNDYPVLLRSVLAGEHVSAEATAAAIGAIMDESMSPVRAAALLAAMAAKGETVDELIGGARAMRERCIRVIHELPMTIDVCGTGGDGAGTINISTAVAFVVAGTGVPVAKHGNRSASNPVGSADVLEAMGVKLDRSPQMSARLLRDNNITFMFAQRHHPAMKTVGPIRRELGVRTIFNVLGPLTNPAGATHQVVGVAQQKHVRLVAEALYGLGSVAGAVVHGYHGLDEVAGDGPTQVAQFDRDGIRYWELDPFKHGVHASLEDVRGGDLAFNVAALTAIIEGEKSPRADLVCLNAALALVVAGEAVNIDDGMVRARRSIEQGAARAALEALRTEHEMEYA